MRQHYCSHVASVAIIRAGLPATTTPLGTSAVTTLAAAIIELLPIVAPARIVAPLPIHTWSPMVTGADRGRGRPAMTSSWILPSMMLVFHDMEHPDPDLNIVKAGQGGAVVYISSRPNRQVSAVVDEHTHPSEDLHGSLNCKVRVLSYVDRAGSRCEVRESKEEE